MRDEDTSKEQLAQELVEARRRITQLETLDTERRWSQRELRQTLRALKVLSGCNQAIIRATEESKLLTELCRVIVDVGGYRLAWVGFTELNRKKTVRLVAQQGYEHGYLATADITWADNERGRGPTGTAIRTGKPVVVRDILTDPGYALWRREAIRHGFASVIALPLGSDQPAFGALNIYATELDAFDVEEMKLLTELAIDLAYGITVLRNETKRQQVKKVMETQKELTDRILDSTPNTVLVLDSDFKILLANQTFYQTFKRQRDEVEGRLVADVLPIKGLGEAIFQTLTERGPQLDLEFRYETESGVMILSSQVVPMGEEVLLILREVTEERARHEQLDHINRLVSIGEVVAGVAHELNNPLASVVGYSELVLAGEIPQAVKNDVEIIHSNAQRAITIVRNLLTFARRQEPHKRLLNVNDLIQHVLEIRGYELKVGNIEVIAELSDELPNVLADPQQLEQVFLNIILNAEQAMLEAHQHGCLTVRTEVRRGVVNITFADNGPGIPEENLRQVFNPFFTTKATGKGTGLGLSICHGIVSQHNGRISAESKLGEGATFFVELPLAEEKEIHPISGEESLFSKGD